MKLNYPIARLGLALCMATASICVWARTDNLDLGVPGKADQVIDREGYALGYDYAWKIPRWVTYRLTVDEIANPAVGRNDDFRPDPLLKRGASQLEDYRGSGYDRGHMAPAGDMKWSAKAMSESFFLSNMCPQDRQNNGGIWNEIEQTVRGFATKEKSVFIVTGPIMRSATPAKTIGANRVAVPDGFYKVVYDETAPEKMIAFVVDNKPMPGKPRAYACSVAEVERTTGLRFFPKLPKDKLALKGKCDPSLWNWSKTQPSSAFKPMAAETKPHWQQPLAQEEYFAGSEMPVGSRKPAPVCDKWPETGYWLSTNSMKRHNKGCENYRKTRGYPCKKSDGKPCGKCGG